LNEQATKQYLVDSGLGKVEGYKIHQIEPIKPIEDFEKIQKYLLGLDGRVNFISYFHYAYCTRTNLLRAIGGYDERFTHYGWEDVDMYLRLAKSCEFLEPDPEVYAIHLHHKSTVNHDKLNDMKCIFSKNDYKGSNVRNETGWGEGE